MICRLIRCLMMGAFAIAATIQAAFAGTDLSGGGTVYLKGGANRRSVVLLDLYAARPSFVDEVVGTRARMPWTRNIERSGKEIADLSSDSGLELALNRLKLWKDNAPVITGILKKSIERTHFYYTFKSFPLLPEYVAPSGVRESELATAAYYDSGFGITFDAKLYSRMNVMSRAALIVHEGLREIQLAFGDGFSDSNLQWLTAQLLLEDPAASTPSLDDPRRFGGFFETLAFVRPAALQAKLDGICAGLESLGQAIPDESGIRGLSRSCREIRITSDNVLTETDRFADLVNDNLGYLAYCVDQAGRGRELVSRLVDEANALATEVRTSMMTWNTPEWREARRLLAPRRWVLEPNR